MNASLFGLPRKAAFVLVGLFLAAAATYSFLWPNTPEIANDSGQYMRTAVDLSDGTIDRLSERPPMLPLLIYATNSQIKPSKTFWFAQLFFYFMSLWLLSALLYSFEFSVQAIYVFIAFMLLPFNIESAGYLMTENLAQFFLVATVFGIVRWLQSEKISYIAVATLALSLSVLTRATYQALPVVLVLFLGFIFVLFRKRVGLPCNLRSAALIFFIGTTVVVGGYAYMNFVKFGYLGVTHLLGYNLSNKTVPYLEKLPEDYADMREYLIVARDKELIKRGSSHTATQFIWSLGPDEIEKKLGLSSPDAARYMLKLNLTLIAAAPMGYLNAVVEAMARYWLPSSSPLANMNSKSLQLLWNVFQLAMVFLFFLELIVLFAAQASETSRRIFSKEFRGLAVFENLSILSLAYLLSLTIIFYTFAITCLVDVGDPRQRAGDGLLIFATIIGFRLWFKEIAVSNSREITFPMRTNITYSA